MSIAIGDRLILDANSVSALGRLALAFVDGGTPWFEWAISQSTERYHFHDETLFVQAVQQGLRASPLALLPRLGLLVSPVKLMTLGLPNLRLLAQAEQGVDGEPLATQVRRILATHKLLTQADLEAGWAQLARLGVAGASVFQAPDFNDRIALCDLLPAAAADEPSFDLQQEAAAFAAAQAHAPAEFVDYHQTYLLLAADPSAPAGETRAERAGRAEAAVRTLLPLLFKTLDCPQVRGLPAPDEVGSAMNDWLMQGKRIGYARLSQAVHQIVRHAPYRGETGHAAHRMVDRYLDSAQAFLATQRPERGLMGQDGATCTYPLASERHQALLQLSGQGVISLREFGPWPDERHPATPARDVDQPEKETAT